MSGLRDLCLKLDDITIEFFEKLDEIYRVQHQLELTMRTGWGNLAKARYIMGTKTVGALQYNEEDLEEALVQVQITEKDKTPTFTLTRDQPTSPSMELTKSAENESTTLRKRKTAIDPDETEELSSAIEELNLKNKEMAGELVNKDTTGSNIATKAPQLKDPIKWFGVLVPQCLRQGQREFQQVQELCCTLATLKGELLTLKADFLSLNKEKNGLLDSVNLPSFMDELNSSGDSLKLDTSD